MKIVQILNVNQKIVYFKENTFISKEINQKVAIKLSFPFSIPQLLPSSWFFRCNSYQTWQTYLKVSDIFSQLESLQIILSHSILSKRIQENLSDNILLMQLVVVLLTQVAALYCMDQEISLIVKLKYSAWYIVQNLSRDSSKLFWSKCYCTYVLLVQDFLSAIWMPKGNFCALSGGQHHSPNV